MKQILWLATLIAFVFVTDAYPKAVNPGPETTSSSESQRPSLLDHHFSSASEDVADSAMASECCASEEVSEPLTNSGTREFGRFQAQFENGLENCGDQTNCLQQVATREAVWQGRWTMWSFISSLGMLLTTAVSIWFIRRSLADSRNVQRLEFQAYLKPSVKLAAKGRSIAVTFSMVNYGRTPATTIMVDFQVFVGQEPDIDLSQPFLQTFKGQILCDIVHPPDSYQLEPTSIYQISDETYERVAKLPCGVLVQASMRYRDVFFHLRKETFSQTFVLSKGPDGAIVAQVY